MFEKSPKPNIKELRKRHDIEGLIEALRHTDWHIRRDAAEALGELKDVRAIAHLIEALKNDDAKVRRNVAFALGLSFFGVANDPDENSWAFNENTIRKVIESLAEAFVKDNDKEVRIRASLSIKYIPIPVKLEEGEEVLKKIKKVKMAHFKGFLLLTNRRLIFHGYSLQESPSIEMPLTEIVSCELKSSLFGKKKLRVTAKRLVLKNFSNLIIEDVAIHGYSEPPASEFKSGQVDLNGIKDPEALSLEIMRLAKARS